MQLWCVYWRNRNCGIMRYSEGRILGKFVKLNSEGKLAWVKCYVGNLGGERAHQSQVRSSQSIINKSQKWNVEQKKQDTKYIYTKFKNRASPSLGLEVRTFVEEYKLLLEKGQKEGLWGVGDSVCWVHKYGMFVNIHWAVHLRPMQFSECMSYLNMKLKKESKKVCCSLILHIWPFCLIVHNCELNK